MGAAAHSPVILPEGWQRTRSARVGRALGWPVDLSATLKEHAVERLNAGHDLFQRLTDAQVQTRLSKRPLEVAASFIARTSHAALDLLDAVRVRTGLEIPLAWNPDTLGKAQVIEVYPAATPRIYGQFDDARKIKDKAERRRALAALLSERFDGNVAVEAPTSAHE